MNNTKTVTIPVTPTDELLHSMATRYNHAFGLSEGYTEEQINEIRKNNPLMARSFLTAQEREAIISTMRKLHEEVVGGGFYDYKTNTH